ncbi:Lrp/AsnC family transcriptional regulator [Niveibacterium umoris]|uniref:siroheme decarboxylase n=1 Tax=Niveibacterium umoris TaxID=1193620 RepID=A0A840BGL2_9RHOO|nr:Lrp/AsnC family transcriptional regulator [Niveibacterium umoris]MBB4011324.1 DNA-binding Lrp family transcriptional regulator [Niveibacterium umoris]
MAFHAFPERTAPGLQPRSLEVFANPAGKGGHKQAATSEETFEFDLINRWQRDLPLETEPFQKMGEAHGRSGRDVLAALRRLRRNGVVSRVGVVLTPSAFGFSTLAAVRVAPEQLDEVAAFISRMPEVNHNYAREHDYNLWFVLTAPDRALIEAALRSIGEVSGCVPLDLPMLSGYHIDLGFDLTDLPIKSTRAVASRLGPMSLDPSQRRLLAELQSGLPLVQRPFARLGSMVGMHEGEVIEQLRQWLATGAIRRLGVVVQHHELGFRANAMCVWDVPDDEVETVGLQMASIPGVNLCYRRARVAGRWPYNLYCMIHGREREAVLGVRESLVTRLSIDHFPSAVLFSGRRYKQCGARYAER